MQSDSLEKIIPIPEMDSFHKYEDPFSNVRYYHYLKARRTIQFIKYHSDKNHTFLDAGAGLGPYSALASPIFKHVYMYEFDDTELNKARQNTIKYTNISSEKVDLRKIPLGNSSIDSIICCEVLEHIPDEAKALLEMKRVLSDSGRILISMPNAFSLFYLKVRNLKNHREIMKKLAEKNLKVTESESVNKIPYPEWEMIRHISFPFWKIEKMIKNAGFKIINRTGVNIIPLPYFLRKFFMTKFQLGLMLWVGMDKVLGKIIPFVGSFYFIEIKK